MSGHSKWSKIKHKKGKNDAARGKIFTKSCKAITIAAREGGGDPDMNFSLRLAIQKAKSDNVPNDNIERAIKRGTGDLKDAAQIEEVLYEGFGPQGVGLIIDSITDNRNRTVSEIKHVLSKYGGSLGGPGSVTWQFVRKGVIRFTADKKQQIADWEDVQLSLMDAGAEDIIDESDQPDGGVEILSSTEAFKEVVSVFEHTKIDPDDTGLSWIATEPLELTPKDEEKIDTLVEALDDLDDVREVFTNVQ